MLRTRIAFNEHRRPQVFNRRGSRVSLRKRFEMNDKLTMISVSREIVPPGHGMFSPEQLKGKQCINIQDRWLSHVSWLDY